MSTTLSDSERYHNMMFCFICVHLWTKIVFVYMSAPGCIPLSASHHYPAERLLYMQLTSEGASLSHFPKSHNFAKMAGLVCDL